MVDILRELVTRSNEGGLDPEPLEPFLGGLQGNIVEPHGRGYSVLVLMTFKPRKIADALDWIVGFNPTSAWVERFDPPTVFRMLTLSKKGYDVLGIEAADQPRDAAFRRGPAGVEGWYDGGANFNRFGDVHAMAVLASDEKSELAEDGWKTHLAKFEGSASGETDFCIYWIEEGHHISRGATEDYRYGPKSGDDYYIEHFGYHDGISNPTFLVPARAPTTSRSVDPKYGHWNAYAPLDVVLSMESPRTRHLTNPYGSYLAFHKLEQDVPGFCRSIRRLALKFIMDETAEALEEDLGTISNVTAIKKKWTHLPELYEFIEGFDVRIRALKANREAYNRETEARNYAKRLKGDEAFRLALQQSSAVPKPLDVERAGAMIVGRYRNGIPAFLNIESVREAVEPTPLASANDFGYEHGAAAMCPVHAHARQMNPRLADRSGFLTATRAPRIARRGIPYGKVDTAALSNIHTYTSADAGAYYQGVPAADPKGLLFISFQASLDSFEAVARVSSVDNLFSRSAKTHEWLRPPDGKKVTQATIEPYMIPRGSAYLFAPSLDFLSHIKKISTLTRGGGPPVI